MSLDTRQQDPPASEMRAPQITTRALAVAADENVAIVASTTISVPVISPLTLIGPDPSPARVDGSSYQVGAEARRLVHQPADGPQLDRPRRAARAARPPPCP